MTSEILFKLFGVKSDSAELIFTSGENSCVSYSIKADDEVYKLTDVIGKEAYYIVGESKEDFIKRII